MRYQIRNPHTGDWDTHESDIAMVNRADMAFHGISGNDIRPPVGFTLSFDTPDREPEFVPIANPAGISMPNLVSAITDIFGAIGASQSNEEVGDLLVHALEQLGVDSDTINDVLEETESEREARADGLI